MSAVARFASRLTPRAILGGGWLVFLLYAYPGYMSSESADQMMDARNGAITDWSSATMSELWRICDRFVEGPFPMLALQSLLLLGGSFVLLRRATSARAAAAGACGVLLFPPVLAVMAVVWRDSLLAGLVVAGAAAIGSPRGAIRGVGLALFVVAGTMRTGAAFAILPVVVVGFAWTPELRGWRRYAIGAAAWIAVALAAIGLEAAMIDADTGRQEVTRAARDVAGVLRYAGSIDDAEVRAAFGPDDLVVPTDLQRRGRAVYDRPADIMTGPDRLFDPPRTEYARDRIVRARDRLAWAHPWAYFAHRRHVLYEVLGLHAVPVWNPTYSWFSESRDQGLAVHQFARHSMIQTALVMTVRWLGQTILFRPYLYFVAAIALLVLAAIRRQREVAALVGGAILYELVLGFVVTTAEYRLSATLIATTMTAAILLWCRRGSRA